MKKYSKPRMLAKNAPTGSYAAGCPSKTAGKTCILLNKNGAMDGCRYCERTL